MKQEKTALLDIEGTIIKTGEVNPKYLGIIELEKIMKKEIPHWDKIRAGLMIDDNNYSRFFSDLDDFIDNDHDERLVIYEGIKNNYPRQAIKLIPIMSEGIRSGEFPVVPYEDTEYLVNQLIEENYSIGTFSGATIPLQCQILAKIPINNKTMLDIVIKGARMQSAKSIGKKTKLETYETLVEIYQSEEKPLSLFVTDAPGEALACLDAFTKRGMTNAKTVFAYRNNNAFRYNMSKPNRINHMKYRGVIVINNFYELK